MSKRKPARTLKARSASKIGSSAAGSGQAKGRANSKRARVLPLLCGPSGATTVTRSYLLVGKWPHRLQAENTDGGSFSQQRNGGGIVFELERIQGDSWNRPADEIRIVAGFPRWLCKFQKRTTTHSALDVMAQDKIHLAVPCRDGNRQDLDAPGQLGIEFKITARRSRLKGFGSKADKRPPGSEWLHEIKHDGFRVIARKEAPR
jgi:hypothetical protein